MIRASGSLVRKTAAVKAPAAKTSSMKVKGSAATALVNPTGTSTRIGSPSNSNAANSLVYPAGVPNNPKNSSRSSSWLPILGIGAVAGIALLAMFGGKLFGGGDSSEKPADWSSTPVDNGGGGAPPPPPEDLSSNDDNSPASQPSDVVSPAAAPADGQSEMMKVAKEETGAKDDSSGAEADPKNAKDRKLDEKTAERKTEKKDEKKAEKKVATHAKACGTTLSDYSNSANLRENLSGLLQGQRLAEGTYTWQTSSDPVVMRVHNGHMQIYVEQTHEWAPVKGLCTNGNLTSMNFAVMNDTYPVQIDVVKNGNQYIAKTFVNGSLRGKPATIGSLSVSGDREIASQSHGGLQ